MVFTKVSIDKVQIGDRHRRDLGDINALADSIKSLGLLQPVGVNTKLQLIWGERRLKACQLLGWTEISAYVDPSMDSTVKAMRAEADENICRKEFTPAEAVAIAEHIEVLEKERAEERQRAARKISAERTNRKLGRINQDLAESVPANCADTDFSHGETRKKIAEAVGMSHTTLTKARKVVADGTPELVAAMDSGAVSVNAAAQLVELPPEKQRTVVAGGKEAVTRALKQTPSAPKREPNERRLKLNRAVERLEELSKLHHLDLSMAAFQEAVEDLRRALRPFFH